MATNDIGWIYLLFFLVIPLSRIIPRLLKKRGMKNSQSQTYPEGQFGQSSGETVQEQTRESPKPQTKDKLVLGELNRGTKKYEHILKNTGLDSNELNSILKDLEKRDLMKVEEKKGPFGTKVELLSTKKGLREYYS